MYCPRRIDSEPLRKASREGGVPWTGKTEPPRHFAYAFHYRVLASVPSHKLQIEMVSILNW